MKIERSRNSFRNSFYGFINKFVTLVFPFIVRSVFIRTLGVEYIGLNSLFVSILNMLNLAELGFNTAIPYSMYKPIAEDDWSTINALLAYYRKVYKIIGFIVLGIGVALTPFLSFIIKGSAPNNISLPVVYIVYLLNNCIGYFLFSYCGPLISAFQRDDLYTKMHTILQVIQYALSIVVLILARNYYLYIIILPIITAASCVGAKRITNKHFPQFKPEGTINQEEKKKISTSIKGLFIYKVGGATRNSLDSLFLSSMIGLTVVGIYDNYYAIMKGIMGFMVIMLNSMSAGIGNSMATESEEKNFKDMERIDFLYMLIAGWCTITLLCLYQPFMKLWGITTGSINLLSFPCVILLCTLFYVSCAGDISWRYAESKGLWWKLKIRFASEIIANTVLNYVLGKIFGIAGIIAATVISLALFGHFIELFVTFKNSFPSKNPISYFMKRILNLTITAAIAIPTYFVTNLFGDSLLDFIIRGVICCILPTLLYLLVYCKTDIFKESMPWITDKVKSYLSSLSRK